jgi:hypothetical protein
LNRNWSCANLPVKPPPRTRPLYCHLVDLELRTSFCTRGYRVFRNSVVGKRSRRSFALECVIPKRGVFQPRDGSGVWQFDRIAPPRAIPIRLPLAALGLAQGRLWLRLKYGSARDDAADVSSNPPSRNISYLRARYAKTPSAPALGEYAPLSRYNPLLDRSCCDKRNPLCYVLSHLPPIPPKQLPAA